MHQQFIRSYFPADAPAEPAVMPRLCGGVFASNIRDEQHLPHQDGDPSCESPSPAVDCTLSLGTPSTRRHSRLYTTNPSPSPAAIQQQKRNACSLSLDFFYTNQSKTSLAETAPIGGASVLRTGGAGLKVGGDTVLLHRRCASCDTTSTPLWRNGPRGPKSLCNACGIRYKKEERRAASYAAAHPSTSYSLSSATSAAAHQDTPPHRQHEQHLTMTVYGSYHHSWGYTPSSRLADPPQVCLFRHPLRQL